MGFDNECILSIQSLPGEYFCPICRLLVYPNEALQSMCTHLYCKPCLTYVVSTTRACPYDGYLVTDTDSKPLTESNKLLAETIGQVAVHCLYHRSGCAWQGTLTDCVSHSSSCAFGNSPVVCNRCTVQIVHRQVQEHAQVCPGVPAQLQATTGTDQTQSATNAAAVVISQAQASQNAVAVPSADVNQQQAQGPVQAAAMPTAEQWYQQQYQPYYQQQYPGYDQYQHQQLQQYYTSLAAQPQAQPGIAPQTHRPPHGTHPQPQPQPYTQYQQPQLHPQIQTQLQLQPPTSQPQLPSLAQPTGQLKAPSQTQNPPTAHPSYPPINTDPQQYAVNSQPQVGSRPASQSSIQLASQFPQQPNQMRPPLSQAMVPRQQQQSLFPAAGQALNIVPPAQQPAQQPYFQLSGPPPLNHRPVMKQAQQTFLQQPFHQLRPLGQSHGYPQLPQGIASSDGTQLAKSPIVVARPSMPSHGLQSQLYTQYPGGVSRPLHHGAHQQPTNLNPKPSNPMQLPLEQHSGVNSKPTMTAQTGTVVLDPKPPAVVAKTGAELEAEISSIGSKPLDSENQVASVSKESKHATEMQGEVNGRPITKEGNSDGTLNHTSNGESSKVITDGKTDVLKDSALEDKKTMDQGGNLVHEAMNGSDPVQQGGFMEPPHPVGDSLGNQPVSSHHGPTTLQQRSGASPLRPPHQNPLQSHFGPRGLHNPLHSGESPPLAFDAHGEMIPRGPGHGLGMHPDQRPNITDGRRLDPHFPRSLERGTLAPNMRGINSFDSVSHMGSKDEGLRFHADRFNSFPNQHFPDPTAEFIDDMIRFPRPFDRGPQGLMFDPVLQMGSRVVSRFLPPNDASRVEDRFGRMDPARANHDFFRPGPSFDRRHRDVLGSRSQVLEHPGMSLRGFRAPGEPFHDQFPESGFSMLPGHLRSGEIEGPESIGLGDRLRNKFLGHDGFPSHLRRGDRMGNMYDDLRSREPLHARMREFGRPGMDSLSGVDRPNYPQLGKPGFSSFSHHGFPNDGWSITGELAFEKKRKPLSQGWCRICSVDCETVEGLDLHSQTREHQRMTMDIVLTIKQNAKRKKLTSDNQPSPGDTSKSRNGGGEDHGKKG